VVAAPANPTPPVVSVEGQAVIGTCPLSSLEYRATARGLASRPAQYQWRAVDTTSETLRELISSRVGAVLLFNAPTLLPTLLTTLDESGTKQTFEVCATNFLGARGCTTFSVFREQKATSSVDIVGASPRRVVPNGETLLPTTVTLRRETEAGCEPVASDSVSRIVYTWRRVAGPSLPASLRLSGAALRLPPGSLQPGARYTLEVDATVYVTSSDGQQRVLRGSENLKDTIELVVAPSAAVQARIEPAGSRTVARKSAFTVDGSASTIDGQVGGSRLQYEWSCYEGDDVRRSCWTSGGAPNSALSAVTFGAFALDAGTYTIALTVSSGTDTSSTSTKIVVTAAEVPTVNIRASGLAPDGSVTPFQAFTLVGSAESTRDREVTAQWSITPPLGGAEVRDDASGGLYVPAGVVQPGVDYTFTYTASDDEAAADGSAELIVRVNGGPRGIDAACSLRDAEGESSPYATDDATPLSVVCRGYDGSDAQLPLAYYVTYQTLAADADPAADGAELLEPAGAAELGLQASPRATSTLGDLLLPVGNQRLFAYVIDAQGGAVRVPLGVVVVGEEPNDDMAVLAATTRLNERRAQLEATLVAEKFDLGTAELNRAVAGETSAEACLEVAQLIRDDYTPATSGYNARQQALWVKAQAGQCKTTPELRAAHLAILRRAIDTPADQRSLPLGTAADVDSEVCCAGRSMFAAVRLLTFCNDNVGCQCCRCCFEICDRWCAVDCR
jgi:hypothetical protein